MSIIAKNITASGIEIPDLSGLYIDSYSQQDLFEYFTMDEIDDSLDLDDAIINGWIVMNDGTQDLSVSDSLKHTSLPTTYEVPDNFLDLDDTPNTYSGTNPVDRFLKIKSAEDGMEFTPIVFEDLNDVPTYSGHEGEVLFVNDAGDSLEYQDMPTVLSDMGFGTDLSALQIRRTTDYTFTTSWADITFDTTDIEVAPAIIKHDDTHTDRMQIGADGYYKITYTMPIRAINSAEFKARFRKNDSSVIPGSYMWSDDSNDTDELSNAFIVFLEDGDYVTLQLDSDCDPEDGVAKADIVVTVIKLDSVKGDKGDSGTDGLPGTGSTINVWEDSILVASGVGNLNFEGNVAVAEDSSGYVTVTVSGSPGVDTLSVVQARRSTAYTITTSYLDVTFNITDEETNTDVIEHNNTNTDDIDIKSYGTYLIRYEADTDAQSSDANALIESRVRKNNSIVLPGSHARVATFYDGSIPGYQGPQHMSNAFIATLSSNDKITLQLKKTDLGSSRTLTTYPDMTIQVIKLDGVKGSDGIDGQDGIQGPSGSGSTIHVYKDSQMVSGSPFEVIDFLGFDVEESTTSGIVTVSGNGDCCSIFGSVFIETSDDSISSTTSTSWQEKLQLDLNNIPDGKYRIGWFYEWQMRNGSFDFRCRLQLDDTEDIMNQQQEPQDANSDQWYPASGFGYKTLSSGNHKIEIDYCSSKKNKTAKIRRARLEFWRV